MDRTPGIDVSDLVALVARRSGGKGPLYRQLADAIRLGIVDRDPEILTDGVQRLAEAWAIYSRAAQAVGRGTSAT